jgi:hypothetical protein
MAGFKRKPNIFHRPVCEDAQPARKSLDVIGAAALCGIEFETDGKPILLALSLMQSVDQTSAVLNCTVLSDSGYGLAGLKTSLPARGKCRAYIMLLCGDIQQRNISCRESGRKTLRADYLAFRRIFPTHCFYLSHNCISQE